MGAAGWYSHRANRISHLVRVRRRKTGIGRGNQRFLTYEAALGTVAQVIKYEFIWFGNRPFNFANFQRPDWICGSFYTTFKLAGLVEIPDWDKRGELFSPLPNRSRIRCRWLCRNSFFFDDNCRSFPRQPGDFVVKSGNNFGRPFYPRSGPLSLRKSHFHGLLVAEQALDKGAVETFNNGLVVVNVKAPAPDSCFVVFYYRRNSALPRGQPAAVEAISEARARKSFERPVLVLKATLAISPAQYLSSIFFINTGQHDNNNNMTTTTKLYFFIPKKAFVARS